MPKRSLFLQSNILPLVVTITISTAPNTIPLHRDERAVRELYLRAETEYKVKNLENFFESYKSPLKAYSESFVNTAEKYGLDYKLLPAISCMESSCGKNLIEGSYNPFGWGIYGNQAIYFKDYHEAIDTVGKGLKEKYVDRGLDTPQKIAPVYTPPNHRNWLSGVNFFINKIDSSNL